MLFTLWRSSLWSLEKTELFTRPLFRPGCHWQSDPWYHECFCASLWSRGNHSTLKKEKVSLVYSLGGRLLRIVILSWLSNNFLTWCNTKFIIATELGRIKYSLGQKLSKNANYQCIFSAIFWLWCGSNSPFHPMKITPMINRIGSLCSACRCEFAGWSAWPSGERNVALEEI